MSDPPNGGKHEKPDDDETKRYDKLDEVAQDTVATRGWSSAQITRQTGDVSRSILAMNRRAAVARADSVSIGQANPSVTFADPSDAAAYDALRAQGQQVVQQATLQRRQAQREVTLATQVAFVPPDRSADSADAAFAALADAADSPGTSPATDPAAAMLRRFRADASNVMPTLGTSYAEVHLDRADLDGELAQLHALEKFTPDEDFLWDNLATALDAAEQLLERQSDDEPVDMGEIYALAAEVEVDGTTLPPTVATQVAAVALSALCGGRPAAEVVNPRLHSRAELFMLGQQSATALVRGVCDPVLGGQARTAQRPSRIAVASEFDLSTTWRRWYDRARAQIAALPDGARRSSDLDLAFPPAFTEALQSWSRQRRRGGTDAELTDAFEKVADAFDQARVRLVGTLGDLSVDALRARAAEGRILLDLLAGYGAEVVREARATARAETPARGRYDGVRAMLEMETARAGARWGEVAAMRSTDFATTVGRQVWAQPLRACLEWDRHRAELTSDKRLLNLFSDAQQFASAVNAARPAIESLRPHDRREWRSLVDATLIRMAAFLRSARMVRDPLAKDPSFLTILNRLDDAVAPVATSDDVVTLWTTTSSVLIAHVSDAGLPLPDFVGQLGPALNDWRDAMAVAPPNPDRVESAALRVLDVLHDYRAEAGRITNPDIVAEYEDLFDMIANSIAARLATMK